VTLFWLTLKDSMLTDRSPPPTLGRAQSQSLQPRSSLSRLSLRSLHPLPDSPLLWFCWSPVVLQFFSLGFPDQDFTFSVRHFCDPPRLVSLITFSSARPLFGKSRPFANVIPLCRLVESGLYFRCFISLSMLTCFL